MTTVIVVPTIKDFLAELEAAELPNYRPTIYLDSSTQEEPTGTGMLPLREFEVSLSAQHPASAYDQSHWDATRAARSIAKVTSSHSSKPPKCCWRATPARGHCPGRRGRDEQRGVVAD